MNTRTVVLFVVLAAVVALALMFFVLDLGNRGNEAETQTPSAATSTEQGATSTDETVASEVFPYGDVEIGLNERAVFPDVAIEVLKVEEDSRCPIDAQCIWAGVLTVSLRTSSGMGTSTDMLSLGETLTTEAEQITFVSAAPERKSGVTVKPHAYQFVFNVEKRSQSWETQKPPSVVTDPAPAHGACYVGGCSSQLCTDTPDMVSTCEYREEYACYQGGECTRQANGQCGWTQTAALRACLLKAQQSSYPQ